MNIEVITTKRKLTKAVIKQLEPASLCDIEYFNSMPTIGYYVRDLGPKRSPRTALFEGLNGWKTIALRDWESHGENRAEVSAKDLGMRGTSVRTFVNEALRDEYISEYNKLKESCLKNHLII